MNRRLILREWDELPFRRGEHRDPRGFGIVATEADEVDGTGLVVI